MDRLPLEEIIEMRMQDCVGLYGTSLQGEPTATLANITLQRRISTKWGRCFKVNFW